MRQSGNRAISVSRIDVPPRYFGISHELTVSQVMEYKVIYLVRFGLKLSQEVIVKEEIETSTYYGMRGTHQAPCSRLQYCVLHFSAIHEEAIRALMDWLSLRFILSPQNQRCYFWTSQRPVSPARQLFPWLAIFPSSRRRQELCAS